MLAAPADSPKSVTQSGSPPNAVALRRAHSRAATWSSKPALPETPSGDSADSAEWARKPNGPNR